MGALAVQGCAGGVSTTDVASFDGAMGQGDYARAANFAMGAGKIQPNGESPNLLWSLNAGAALVYAGDNTRTVPVLDHAEDMMKSRDESEMVARGQYRAKTYDSVMVNTYKAISAMQAGNSAMARTELIRADDRQRIA